MSRDPRLTGIATMAGAAADALRADGAEAAAGVIEMALAHSGPDHEWLLVIREALIVTRPGWEALDDSELADELAAAVAMAKRLAIEL